ncbi:MAG: glycosyltransferase [Candidatus Woesearchaeota archaeon]
MKVLMLGNYKKTHYVRGLNIYNGLLKNKVETELVLARNFFEYLKMFFRIIKRDYDIIILRGKPVFLLAYLTKIIHRKKILFDVFISDYESLCVVKKTIKNKLLKKLIWFSDKFACEKSDFNILDTKFHIEYFVNEFKLNKKKFEVVFVGADDKIFFPEKKIISNDNRNKKFKIAFYGSFIPGHGIDVMLKAAKLIEKDKEINPKNENNIVFDFIGYGPLHNEMVDLSKKLKNKNVNFLGWINFNELPKKLQEYDLCLGLFDDSVEKVKRVIPTKVFEILALKKVCITGKNKCMEYYFKDNENILLCEMGSPEDLAEKIKFAYLNKEKTKKIAEIAYIYYKKTFTPKKIGEKVKEIIKNILIQKTL